MQLPEHLMWVMALPRAGVPVHMAFAKSGIPTVTGRHLTLISDDPDEGTGGGPAAWNGAALRRLLLSLNSGALGIFAGAPLPSAYETLSLMAATLPGGAVIIEVSGARFAQWFAYVQKHARCAFRYDVAPRGWQPPPSVLHLGTLSQ